ncbi:MAG: citrate synthase [Leptolyngbya sp. PLA3]|nr:MAG: citrate synthase [Cyanobacteria bacterium CYA]MCE7969876.1 citrate synthase [Leptolyngbya sp. PL-A3]
MTQAISRGLEGVIAGETQICSVEQGALIYRGYEIHDLARNATFEEVAHLLLVGHKPSPDELEAFKKELAGERALPESVIDFLQSVGKPLHAGTAVPMDVLRTGVSILAHTDADCQDNSPEANLRKAKRLTAKIPTIIGHMQNVYDGVALVAPKTGGDPSLSHAGNLLYLMTGKRPTPSAEHIMDVSLMLYAEHDYNASTFAGRVIAGTLSDLHGAVAGAIAALKGPLHGGANEAAMEMLKEIRADIGPENDRGQIEAWMHQAFADKRKLMGFGHRVYKNGDHRAPILHALGRELARQTGEAYVKLFELGEEVQRIMLTEKKIHPNVDFPCGMTYYTMGIPVPQYTPIFAAARVTGWTAHIMEQHANNRLIRPIAAYTGPALKNWKD